ncbi:MAG: hypothetical protein ACLP0J_20070, partial [Solirubrobacteraceae bacterium]
CLVGAYVVLKLIPTLKQALRSLEHVSWEWVLGALPAFPMLAALYDPHDGRGMGAEDFAWSALALELLDPSNASAGMPIHRA